VAITNHLGSGQLGSAFEMTLELKDGQTRNIVGKVLNVGDEATMLQEAHWMDLTRGHPSFIEFYGTFRDGSGPPGKLFLLMEKMDKTYDTLQRKGGFRPPPGARRVAEETTSPIVNKGNIENLLVGMQHLHSLDLLHTDIKRDNLFIKNNKMYLGDLGNVTPLSKIDETKEVQTVQQDIQSLGGALLSVSKAVDPTMVSFLERLRDGHFKTANEAIASLNSL
jgi:serine/threonine protein kinase